MGLILQAAHFAADKHRDQRRKGVRNTPYINHPLEVAERLNRVGGIEDPIILAAAILHDTIEDTETTEAELRRLFGPEIAALVVELSDEDGLSWQERKRLEIEHAATISDTAKLIKLSDKTSNVADTVSNPPGEWTLSRRRDYLEFARLVADGCRGVNAALDEEFERVLAGAEKKLR
ncbi:MAG: bifunctional (p)ppGpp synthetase/guanosine-3',5'-bis(diphosphate) 3'-pyrophosphohydrolase [Proteobacteria bacterium]|nr:bifunctional (p)ppGpp synthetase/guanosine-3',5'-bis(diphosphate) 3'-pyrophosphohydrolase [Pseudomonadota bacterium]